jgi:hypothetical protein
VELRKRNYFEKTLANVLNLKCFVLYCFINLLNLNLAKYIVIKYNLEFDWGGLWMVTWLLTSIAIIYVANALVLAKESTWIVSMRSAILEEYLRMTPSDAWYVAEAAKYVKAKVIDLTPLEEKAVEKILKLEKDALRLSEIKYAEERLLGQCRDTLTWATNYSDLTGRSEDTTDLRHVLTTMITELEEKLKIKK